MSFLEFFDRHTFLAFLVLCSAYYLSVRFVRMVMVLTRGWPTPPLDADGDIRLPGDDA